MNRNVGSAWSGGGCDRVNCDGQRISAALKVGERVGSAGCEFGTEVRGCVPDSSDSCGNKDSISALDGPRIESNVSIKVHVHIGVGDCILDSDDHLVGPSGGVTLSKSHKISIPVEVVVAVREVKMILRKPAKLPRLCSVEAHERAVILAVGETLRIKRLSNEDAIHILHEQQ